MSDEKDWFVKWERTQALLDKGEKEAIRNEFVHDIILQIRHRNRMKELKQQALNGF